jgi:hypothetical protein
MEGKQPQQSEEIDLFYMFRPVYRRTTRHFAALKANLLLFIGIVVVFCIIGFCLRYIVPRRYETEGVFGTRFLPAKYCALMIGELDRHTGEPLVGERLHIGNDVAGNITSLELLPMAEKLDVRDSVLQGFILRIWLKNVDQLDSIQKALIGYFENNDFALRQKTERNAGLTALRDGLDRQIRSLDSITPIVNSSVLPHNTGQGMVLWQPVDPVSVYRARDSFLIQRIRVESELTRTDNIEVVQSFSRLSKPNFPKLGVLFLWVAGGGLLLALIFTPFLGRKPREAGVVRADL